MVLKISVTILTKNSEAHIHRTLHALQDFDEVIVLDNGSTDGTIEVASGFPNVKVFENRFIGFGPLKNLAASFARHEWILSIDSDEIVTEGLLDEIARLNLKNDVVYSLQRQNHYGGILIKCCGWYPDRIIRLYNKHTTSYKNCLVHESIIVRDNIDVHDLEGYVKHYPFADISDLIDKMQQYSTLFAEEHRKKKYASPLTAVFRAVFSFMKDYFWRRGFLSGYEGLVISVSNANGVFYKYMKLYENNRR